MGTILAMFMASSELTMPTSIKFWLCNLSPTIIEFISKMLALERSKINKIFIQYNSFESEFEDLSPSPYIGLFNPQLNLKMVSLKNCKLTNGAVSSFLQNLTNYTDEESGEVSQHHHLKYLDLTGNLLTDDGKIINH
jgi:hypothetical protein